MFRLSLLCVVFALSVPGATVDAQGRGWNWHRNKHSSGSQGYNGRQNRSFRYGGYQSAAPGALFGFSFGTTPYGYDYAGYPDPYFTYPYSMDPWARGSFRAPDLLDDPYFYDRIPPNNRGRHSRFPRSAPPVPLFQRGHSIGGVRAPLLRVDGQPPVMALSPDPIMSPTDGQLNSLQAASDRLLLSLATSEGGDAWIQYFDVDRIVSHVRVRNRSQLSILLARFDGIAGDRQYHLVTGLDGFQETRELLRHQLSQTGPAIMLQEVQPEDLPPPTMKRPIEDLPEPQPILESPSNERSDI